MQLYSELYGFEANSWIFDQPSDEGKSEQDPYLETERISSVEGSKIEEDYEDSSSDGEVFDGILSAQKTRKISFQNDLSYIEETEREDGQENDDSEHTIQPQSVKKRPWIPFLEQENHTLKPKTPNEQINTQMSMQRKKNSSGQRSANFIQTMEGAIDNMMTRNQNYKTEAIQRSINLDFSMAVKS